MAQTIPCDMCEVEPAVMLVTMIQTGDGQGVGINCLSVWARSLADTIDQQRGVTAPGSTESDEDPSLLAVANPQDPPPLVDNPEPGTPAIEPGKAPRKRAPRKATASASA